jgi:hypothetical protein
MTAPPTSIIPLTMHKADGAAPRDPVRPVASLWRANHDRSTVTTVPSLVSPCTDRDRIGRAVLIHSSPLTPRRAHAAMLATPTALSP